MEDLVIKSVIGTARMEELSAEDRMLVDKAIEATSRSYAPYSQFHVGAALLLQNGVVLQGCNQENAAFPVGMCAERAAIFAAGAQYPDVAVKSLAIAARDKDGNLVDEPVSPCGSCRQVLIETETRFQQEVRILLYGRRCIYIIKGIKQLMPLSFTNF